MDSFTPIPARPSGVPIGLASAILMKRVSRQVVPA